MTENLWEVPTFERPVLPKPKKPATNTTPMFSARVDRELQVEFRAWAKSKGLTMKQATEFALKCAMHAEP